jgi:anti-sigma regulatory factor (Ser/Thr protein kinase)
MTGTTVTQVSLLARPSAARDARRWVCARLVELRLEPLADAVELLTSEVVTNALIHAGTPMVLRLRPQGAGVEVEVEDGSSLPPARRHYSSTATTGRGVEVLDSLADEWGWRADPVGKTVWFRVQRAREVWAPFDLDGLLAPDER